MTNDGQVDVFLLKYIYFDVISVRILDIHESFSLPQYFNQSHILFKKVGVARQHAIVKVPV
jgi:hypothetical protein